MAVKIGSRELKAMTKIAVVTTGGTIGSEKHGSVIEIDSKGSRLNTLIRRTAQRRNIDVEVVFSLNKLSENFEPSDWLVVNDTVNSLIDRGIGNIVITHGTDTPHFTGTFLSLFPKNRSAKICLTGAYYSPDHENSDADRNISVAISYVLNPSTPTGVFAAFATDDNGSALVARTTELVPLRYDELRFRSLFGDARPNFDGQSVTLCDELAKFESGLTIEQVKNIKEAQGAIGLATSYPGDSALPWRCLPKDGVLVVESYHGGTATNCKTVKALSWLRDERPDLAICLTSIPSRYIPVPYETSRDLSDRGIWVLKDVSPHVVYVTALARLAAGFRSVDALTPFKRYKI